MNAASLRQHYDDTRRRLWRGRALPARPEPAAAPVVPYAGPRDWLHVATSSLPVSIMPSIIAVVCLEFDVTRLDLLSARRTKDLVVPRQLAMYLARTLTTMTMTAIGRRLGNRDHTTVIHGNRQTAARIAKNEDLAARVRHLSEQVYAHAGLRVQFFSNRGGVDGTTPADPEVH